MKRPSRDHQAKFNPKSVRLLSTSVAHLPNCSPLASICRGYDVIDVVIDPVLSDKMRPHQKEGVKVRFRLSPFFLPRPLRLTFAHSRQCRSLCTSA